MKKILLLLLILTSLALSQNYYKGLIFDDEAYQKIPTTAKILTRDLKSLPLSVSLKPYAPVVGNQGKTGTCTAWATAYGARTIVESIQSRRVSSPKTNTAVFSPSYIYNQIRYDKSCKYGIDISKALKLMENQGVAKLHQFAFDCNKSITKKTEKMHILIKLKIIKHSFSSMIKIKLSLLKRLSPKKSL